MKAGPSKLRGFKGDLRPGTSGSPTGHQQIELNYYDSGRAWYLLAGQRVFFEPRRLALFWAAVPHELIVERPLKNFRRVSVPLSWVLGWNSSEKFRQALLNGEILFEPAGSEAKFDSRRMNDWVVDIEKGQKVPVSAALLELEARMKRLDASGAARRGPPAAAPGPARAGQDKSEVMLRYIAGHYTRDIKIVDIARAARLHPGYAMTLFKSARGESLNHSVNRHRIFHALRMLVSTDKKMPAIAAESGFGSPSLFYYAFRKFVGLHPKKIRASAALHR